MICCSHCTDLRAYIEAIHKRLDALEQGAAKALGASGGKARAASLTVDERKHAARHAVTARWKKAKG